MAVKNRQPIRTYDATYALATKSADDLLHGEPTLYYAYCTLPSNKLYRNTIGIQ